MNDLKIITKNHINESRVPNLMYLIMFLFSGTTVLLRLKQFYCPYLFSPTQKEDRSVSVDRLMVHTCDVKNKM